MQITVNKKAILLQILKEKSYRYRSNPPFILASGKESNFYVDCKPTATSAKGMLLIGEIIAKSIEGLDISAIGGLTMGADPIAYAAALVSTQNGRPLNAFSVRKAGKDHGSKRLIEGDVMKGDKVVIVDDVITTGGSALQAIHAAQFFGLQVLKVVALVDRQEGGKQEIQKHVKDVEAVFTLQEIAEEPIPWWGIAGVRCPDYPVGYNIFANLVETLCYYDGPLIFTFSHAGIDNFAYAVEDLEQISRFLICPISAELLTLVKDNKTPVREVFKTEQLYVADVAHFSGLIRDVWAVSFDVIPEDALPFEGLKLYPE